VIFFAFFQFSIKCLCGHIFSVGHLCHIACGAQNISRLVKPHWNLRPACCEWCKWFTALKAIVSAAIKQRHALSQTWKQLVMQLFPHDSVAYATTRLDGTWTESLKLQAWGGGSNGTNLKPIPPYTFF
jgi:hypothetical protein